MASEGDVAEPRDLAEARLLITILSEQLGDDIPEADYSLLETVESCAAYLHERAGSA